MELRRITSLDALVTVARSHTAGAGGTAASGRFDGADLSDLRIERLRLVGASFREADLRRTVFVECNLSEADVSSARGLLPSSFQGCDLPLATLPDGLSFDGPLATIEGAVSYARAAFVAMAAASLYCLLTVAATTDRDLLVDTASTALPIVETPVALTAFYFVSPMLLLAVVVWMHAYLQRIWATRTELPSRFPDGVPLGDRIDQWIPLSMGSDALARRRDTFGQLEATLSVVLLWPITPVVMGLMWARYLPRHDSVVSVWQIAILALYFAFSAIFAIRAYHTIRRTGRRRRHWLVESGWGVGAAAVTVAVLLPMTLAVIDASPEGPLGARAARLVQLAEMINLPHRLDLSSAEVAARPAGWSPALGGDRLLAVLASLGPVDLAHRNLDRALASSTFFAKARLDGAGMRAINAPLAVFVQASLVGADLKEAQLLFADLRDTDLAGATLTRANLTQANLRGACFAGANLIDARLDGADLRGADLAGAFGLTETQIATAVCDQSTRLPSGLSLQQCGGRAPDGSVGHDIDDSSYLAESSVIPSSCS